MRNASTIVFALVNAVLLILAIALLLGKQTVAAYLQRLLLLDPGEMDALAHEIGFALLVGVVLNISIEAFNRRRHREHMEDLEEHLVEQIFKRQIPDELFEQVQSYLLKAPFFRKKMEMRLTICGLEKAARAVGQQHSDLALVLQDISFTLHNISGVRQRVRIPTSFSVIRGLDDVVKVLAVAIGQKQFGADEIRAARSAGADFVGYTFEGYDLPPGEEVDVRIYSQHIRYKRDEFSLVPVMPTDGIRIRLVFPARDFIAKASSIHPRDEKNTSTPEDTVVFSWELPYATFPGQGLWCSWKPREGGPPLQPDELAKLAQEVHHWVQNEGRCSP